MGWLSKPGDLSTTSDELALICNPSTPMARAADTESLSNLGSSLPGVHSAAAENERRHLNKMEGELIPKSCLLTSVARARARTHR